jgi:Zn-dependent peptidase ImmA (M78 family)
MTLRRGFKSDANNIALEARAELGVPAHSSICPFSLAENLEIPVFTLEGLASLDPSVREHTKLLAGRQRSAFSAITVFDGCRRCIIHNDRHAPVRRRSNVSHELAHALLMHPPHPPFCSAGSRIYKRELEEEANWMGPVLLVSNEAARWAMVQGISVTEAAKHFGVSEDLMEFRLRMSGARQIQHRMRSRTK